MKKRSAFTIVELLVSIMIIGILSSLGYQQYTKAILKANAAGQISQFKSLEAAMAKYYADTGTMPTDLSYLFESPKDVTEPTLIDVFGFVDGSAELKVKDYWGGPYMEKISVGTDANGTFVPYTDTMNCAGILTKSPSTTAKCVKAKLGGKICVGSRIDGGNYLNVFILDKINVDMVKEIFTMANGKAVLENGKNVADFNTSDKLGIGSSSDYATENGCIVWRFYDSALKN